MLEKPVIETAQQRAERIWRNNQIQRKYTIIDDTSSPNWDKITEYERSILQDKRLNAISAKLAREIREIVTAKYNQQSIVHYLISIKSRRYRLLKEKLRRLEAEQNGKS